MTEPRMLDVPAECVEVFGMFVMACVDEPDEFAEAFEILLRHSSEAMLRLLSSESAEDLTYTMLCYMPADLREVVAQKMADDEALREQALNRARQCQGVLRQILKDRIASGDKSALTLLKSA